MVLETLITTPKPEEKEGAMARDEILIARPGPFADMQNSMDTAAGKRYSIAT